jgi:hypothetical protein
VDCETEEVVEMTVRHSGEAIQEALNPHRREEQERAAAHTRDMLTQRGIRVDDGDGLEALAEIEEAVERFEAAVRVRGGDSFLNSPQSSQPENPDWVVPARAPGESAPRYVARVLDAAERLRG